MSTLVQEIEARIAGAQPNFLFMQEGAAEPRQIALAFSEYRANSVARANEMLDLLGLGDMNHTLGEDEMRAELVGGPEQDGIPMARFARDQSLGVAGAIAEVPRHGLVVRRVRDRFRRRGRRSGPERAWILG